MLIEIHQHAEQIYPLETGGILLGYEVGGDLVVTKIIGPGPNASHRARSFLPDHEYQNEAIANCFEISRGLTTYLGDWHTHPDGAAKTSPIDRRTLRRIGNHTENLQVNPAMLIIAGRYDSWVKAAFYYPQSSKNFAWLYPPSQFDIRHFSISK